MATREEILAAGGTVPGETATPDFTKVLQDRVLASADMISSANTGIETAIQGAIGQVQKSTAAGTAAVESKYNREIGYTQESQQRQLTAARERGVGVNTSDVAYKALASEADKNIKDLEQRKNELMLQNDAAGAAQVSQLMLQTLQMKNQAMQQTFTNLLSMSNLNIQQQQEQRAAKAQNFAEKSAISSIGLQYGIPVGENDTLQSIVTKAAPMASATQKAQLAKLVAETHRAEAEAAKASREGKVVGNLTDPLTRNAYITMALHDPQTFNTLMAKDTSLVSIRTEAVNQQQLAIEEKIRSLVANGGSYESVKAALDADTSLGANIDPLKTDRTILQSFDKYSTERTKTGETLRKTKAQLEAENKQRMFMGLPPTSSPSPII